MPKYKLKLSWLMATGVVALLLLAGCGPSIVYDYVPPEDSDGRFCVTECGYEKSYCLDGVADAKYEAERDYQDCLDRRERKQKAYEICVQNGDAGCISPRACFRQSTGRSEFRCERSYRQCYKDCGGTVIRTEIE